MGVMDPRRAPARWLRPSRIAVGMLTFFVLLALNRHSGYRVPIPGLSSLPCQYLPGGNDVVVVMRTGVTQIEAALTVHLETTLKCPPNTIIFSDHEELYQGKYEIRDVLANIDPSILAESDEFALWRKVHEVGREGLDPGDITGSRSTSKTDKDMKLEISGWVLDKWKFLPMINETYHLRPNDKWYIFIETDTYLFWSTTLKYLETLDHTQPHVIGHRSTVKSDIPFMHGGSAFIISNAAMQLSVDYIQANREALDKFVAAEWAGDIALAYVFQQIGIPLTASWPIYKPHYVGILDFALQYEDKRFWCYPVGSFHHMTPDAVREMWHYEQQWIRYEYDNDLDTLIRHADVFNDFVLPRLRLPRDDWDNQSKNVEEDSQTIEECEDACRADERCMQYSFDSTDKICKTLDSVRMGEAGGFGSGIYSDWLFERIQQWRDDQPPCDGEWFLYYSDSPVEDMAM